jgi:hypothetical protein
MPIRCGQQEEVAVVLVRSGYLELPTIPLVVVLLKLLAVGKAVMEPQATASDQPLRCTQAVAAVG